MSAKTYVFLCAQKEYLGIHLIAVRNNIQDQNKVTEYRMMWQRVYFYFDAVLPRLILSRNCVFLGLCKTLCRTA